MKGKFMLILANMLLLINAISLAQNPLQLKNPIPGGAGRSIQQIVATSGGNTFFNTVDVSNQGSALWGLWKTDGTAGGTEKLNLTYSIYNTSSATLLTPLGNNKIIFAGDNVQTYGEIWVTDGTQAGTITLESFNTSGYNYAPVLDMTSLGNFVLYGTINSNLDLQLKRTDGTLAGTSLVHDFGDAEGHNQTAVFKAMNGIVYFDFYNATLGYDEIWRSDGTPAGTYALKNMGTYGLASYFMPVGNVFYFVAINTDNSMSLWKSDGTSAGTVMVKQLSATFSGNDAYPAFSAIGNILYFRSSDGINGSELWRTDGTNAGTYMLANINPGSASSSPGNLCVLNNVLYFSANNGSLGNELWKYDPAAGTGPALVTDIFPGSTGSNPSSFTVHNNSILFSASSSTQHGNELWITDGTAANTVEIANINTTANASSTPSLITTKGNDGYFTANVDMNGDGTADPCIYKYTTTGRIWTGRLSNDGSNAGNWFPASVPGSSDNVLIATGAANSLANNPFLISNDLTNNGTVDVGNGLILMNGNFFNSGIVNNTGGGVFALVSNANLPVRTIGSSGTFNGQLTLSSGVNARLTADSYFPLMRIEGPDSLYLDNNDLFISGFSMNQGLRIITDTAGVLGMPVGSTPVVFPVMADNTSYTPVTINQNNGNSPFYVSVKNGVRVNGTTGNLIAGEAVNKTWNISPGSPSAVANITLQWNAQDELPGFNRSHVYLNHYTTLGWDAGTVGISGGSNPYTLSRTNMSSFSPFTVFSSLAPLAVAEPGAALNFDGINDFVSIPHNALLKPASAITIEAWVKPGDIHSNAYYEIYRKEDGNARHLFSFQNNGTVLSFGLETGGVYSELDVPITASNYENQWVHLAATYDGATKKIYRNGVLIGSQNATGAIGTSGTAAATIGSFNGTSEFFKGSIDEVRLWNKALSAAEIQSGLGCESDPATQNGLIALYHFNQGLGAGNNNMVTVLYDSSGHNLHGTLNNFALSGNISNWISDGAIVPNLHCNVNTTIYTFNGNGNWSNPGNWIGGVVPPSNIPANTIINIKPSAGGECIIDVPVSVPAGASLNVRQGKKIKIPGSLEVN